MTLFNAAITTFCIAYFEQWHVSIRIEGYPHQLLMSNSKFKLIAVGFAVLSLNVAAAYMGVRIRRKEAMQEI